MSRHGDVEVLTTRAVDYITWKNHYPARTRGRQRRPGPALRRDPARATPSGSAASRSSSSRTSTRRRTSSAGSTRRARAPRASSATSGGTRRTTTISSSSATGTTIRTGASGPSRRRASSSRRRSAIRSSTCAIFRDLFRLPRAFVYNSVEEREMINRVSGNAGIPGDVVGVGIEVPAASSGARFRAAHGIDGRLHPLHRPDRREQGLSRTSSILPPVQGRDRIPDPARPHREARSCPIPAHPDIVPLGFLPEQDKFDAPRRGPRPRHALLLREPVHGHPRGLGDAEARPGQRPLRGPQGPVPADRTPGSSTRTTGSSARPWRSSSAPPSCGGPWARTAGRISRPTTPGTASKASTCALLGRLEGKR